MRTDIVRMYKDIHTWVGIVSGLALFIAFYAGAITMFEVPLHRWASAPSDLPAAVSLEDAPKLVAAAVAARPETAKAYVINLETGPDRPARLEWRVRPPNAGRGEEIRYGAALAPDGRLVAARVGASPVAEFVDGLHQKVGLPLDREAAMPIMGAVALLYAVALVSGMVVLLPSLVKDLFVIRAGRNLKRMWLDVHNVLGVLSLPFHIVMALTAVVFAFHDQFYDSQNLAIYDRKIEAQFAQGRKVPAKPSPDAVPLAPAELAARLKAQVPTFRAETLEYRTNPKGVTVVRAQGSDPRFAMRGPTFGFATLDAYTGEIADAQYLPGRQSGWIAAITGFFALHFGSFGGDAVRWGYFVLGLAGAFLFYSGNLLWMETRRKRAGRQGGRPDQSRSTRVLGSLTVGISLGCVAGISATIAAAKWLSGRVADLEAWHTGIYYAMFLAAVGWAFLRGAARAGVELLCLCAAATALIPLSSLASPLGLGGWNHADGAMIVDLTALAGAAGFAFLAARTRRRARTGPADSVWSAPRRPEPAMAPTEGLEPPTF